MIDLDPLPTFRFNRRQSRAEQRAWSLQSDQPRYGQRYGWRCGWRYGWRSTIDQPCKHRWSTLRKWDNIQLIGLFWGLNQKALHRCNFSLSFACEIYLLPVQATKTEIRGAWVSQSVEHLTPNFSSGHYLRVERSSPIMDSALSISRLENSLSLSLHRPYMHALSCKLTCK